MKLHLKHYHMTPNQFRRRTSALKLPEEIHRLYQETSKRCDGCNEGAPAPSRSIVTGLRADSFGDLIFVDHAKVRHNDKLYLVLLILDGATNLLTARVVESETAEVTLEAFREWMDNFQCCPKTLVSDMAFQHPDFQKFYRYHGIKPIATGPRTPWPNRAETAVRLFKRQLALMTKYLGEEPQIPPSRTWFRNVAGQETTSSPSEERLLLSWPLEGRQNQSMIWNSRTQHNFQRTHRRKTQLH